MAVPITTGLQLHLDAEAITGLTDGDRVSQWDDSSSNTNHAVQNTEVDQPTYKVNVINGKPVVRFTSASEYLVASNHASINIADNNITMFIVFAFANKRDSTTSFREDIINKYRNYSLEAGANSGSIVSAFRSGSWKWYATTKNSWNANQFYILTNRRDRTNTAAHFYVDNSLDSSHSLYNGDAETAYDLLVGSGSDYNTPGNYLEGDIAEILIYDRVLSDTERDDVEQYLHSKWLTEPSNNAEVDIINTGQAIELAAGVEIQTEVDLVNTGQVLDSEITVEGKAEVDITNAGQVIESTTNVEASTEIDIINVGQVIESEAKVTDKVQLVIINDDQTVESNAAVKVKTDIDLANSGQGIDVDANVEPEGGVWVDIINDYQEVNSEADVYLSANADIVNGGQGVDVVGSIKVHSEVDISNDSQQVAVNVEPIITIEVDVINSDQVTESNATVEIDAEVDVVNLDQELSGNIKGRPGLDVDIINHGQTLEVNAESLLFTEIGIINDDQGLEIQAGVIYDANINLFNEPQEIAAEAKVRAKLEAGLINEDQTFIAKLYEHIFWDVYITVKPKGIELTATQVPTFTNESKNIRVKITS